MQAIPATDHPPDREMLCPLETLLFRQHLLQSVQRKAWIPFKQLSEIFFFFFLTGKLLLRAEQRGANNRVTPPSKLGNGILKCNHCPQSLLGL